LGGFRGGYGGFGRYGAFGRYGGYHRPFYGRGFGHRFAFGFGLSWPWFDWPGPYYGYYGYPYCDPFSFYPCYPYDYGSYGTDPYAYDPYISDPVDPPDPPAATGGGANTRTVRPPSAPPAVADGQWHRFGAGRAPAAAASVKAAPVHTPSSPAAYAGEGKWRHFGERGDTVAKANSRPAGLSAAWR
jgi:hypothetical protein